MSAEAAVLPVDLLQSPQESPVENLPLPGTQVRRARLWRPQRVLFTPAALSEPYGKTLHARLEALGLPLETLGANRLTGLRGESERATYNSSKRTLAVVTAPPGAFKLQPIPPSADWQFHLAEGCPAHCQYCYLAGSLSGPPIIRAFANLPAILDNLKNYEKPDAPTTYEVSCYTDPLGIEHLTGSLAECIQYFGTRPNAYLRWVSKFDAVEPLLDLPHNGHTRCRFSVNAFSVERTLEGGTASVEARLLAARRMALPRASGGGGYPVGLVVAPIMPMTDWEAQYGELLDAAAQALDFPCDLTFELITHRFTPGSVVPEHETGPGRKHALGQAQQVRRHEVCLSDGCHEAAQILVRAGDCVALPKRADFVLDVGRRARPGTFDHVRL
jgi:spore photoproduct lyase